MKQVIQFIALFFGFLQFNFAQTVTSLWNQYKANPYNHPNIPNNSYAGYGTGNVPLPNPSSITIDVTKAPYNAKPDDNIDDQPAIQNAINAAGTAGGGIVYLPAGNYILNKPLFIKYNNVIVRGQGSTGSKATILDFKFSIYSAYKSDIPSNRAAYLWGSGGLVWIAPTDALKPNGAANFAPGYENWRFNVTLATVTSPAKPGDFSITVNNASSLTAGMRVLLTWQLPADRSFIKLVYGHTPTESGIDNNTYVGDCSKIRYPKATSYVWPAYIKSINKNIITLDRPLRLKIDPNQWPTAIRKINSMITESGIENVQIKGYNTSKMAHLATPTSTTISGKATLAGWNGVYINRAWNCWANNIRFVNLECGAILADAKNCSVLNTYVTSTDPTHWYHYPYAVRHFSSDNLIENFTIDGPGSVRHGISTDWYSSGNVYSKGLMKVGTFDTHRGASFDMMRTEITVANDHGSSSGGDALSGPYAGKRFAHWNIIQKIQPGYPYQDGAARTGDNIFEPLQYPMGVLVAITGPRDNSVGEFVPPPLSGGNLGTIAIPDLITDPALTNLYHAELSLRNQLSPFTLNATTSGKGTVSKTPIQTDYESGTKVTLTATPAAGQKFTGWSRSLSDTTNPLIITMDSSRSIIANFQTLALVKIDTNGNGRVVKYPDMPNYLMGSTITLTAIPEQGYQFTGWTGDTASTINPLTITIDTNKTVVANFQITNQLSPLAGRASSPGIKRTNSNALNIKLSPNPARNILNIYATGLQKDKQSNLSVISSSGEVLKTTPLTGLTQTIQLDVTSLPVGVYDIKLITGDKIMYKQFVKQ